MKGAPAGNQFWKLRSKHGRDKLFATHDLMCEAACDYFQWVVDNPEHETKPIVTSNGKGEGSSVELIEIPVKQPFTLHGLCLYIDCSTSYFRTFRSTIKPEDKDFLTVIEKIEETIYNQKFSGAASGFFNSNIIARDLGLKDQSDVNVTDHRKQTGELFPDELQNNISDVPGKTKI